MNLIIIRNYYEHSIKNNDKEGGLQSVREIGIYNAHSVN